MLAIAFWLLSLQVPAPIQRIGVAPFCNVDPATHQSQCNYDSLSECLSYAETRQRCEANPDYQPHPIVQSTPDHVLTDLWMHYQTRLNSTH